MISVNIGVPDLIHAFASEDGPVVGRMVEGVPLAGRSLADPTGAGGG